MEGLNDIINSLPMWAKVVSVFIILVFGVGGFSNIWTKILSKKKIESEANLENSTAVINISTAEKTTTDLAKELIDEYKGLVENERQNREKLEVRIDSLEKSMDNFKKTSEARVKKLQSELDSTERRLLASEKEVKLLKAYLGIVKLRWSSITDEPFPDENTIIFEEYYE